jgi:hypothetical protein
MRRAWLFLLLTSCSKGPQADLQYISQARSLAAEWALINQLAAEGKLTGTYVAAMHQSLREQVETTAKALTEPDSPYALEIRAIAAAPDNTPPQHLRAASDRLKAIEDKLESA